MTKCSRQTETNALKYKMQQKQWCRMYSYASA